jgi:hypothetical protein
MSQGKMEIVSLGPQPYIAFGSVSDGGRYTNPEKDQ